MLKNRARIEAAASREFVSPECVSAISDLQIRRDLRIRGGLAGLPSISRFPHAVRGGGRGWIITDIRRFRVPVAAPVRILESRVRKHCRRSVRRDVNHGRGQVYRRETAFGSREACLSASR